MPERVEAMTSADCSGRPLAVLSDRRQQVARLVAGALLDKQIAAELGITHDHVRRIVSEIADAWNLERDKNIRVQIAIRYHATNIA